MCWVKSGASGGVANVGVARWEGLAMGRIRCESPTVRRVLIILSTIRILIHNEHTFSKKNTAPCFFSSS